MKLKKLQAFLACTVLFFSIACNKSSETVDDTETTFQLSGNQAVSESLADDANVVFFEAAVNKGLTGARVGETTNTLSCATVTVTPQNTFPKTITIDFGAGCTSIDGISRKGKINIVLTDSVRHNGATATMTFENYYVGGYKVEGTITWTNTSTPNTVSWTRSISNGKVTRVDDGYYWMHTGTTAVTQTAGGATPLNLLDDIYSVTGNHTVTNPVGKTRTATVTEALEKKTICHNVTKGKLKIEGPNHFAIIDYGDGSCDNVVTVSIDGHPARTIVLP